MIRRAPRKIFIRLALFNALTWIIHEGTAREVVVARDCGEDALVCVILVALRERGALGERTLDAVAIFRQSFPRYAVCVRVGR